MRSPDALTSLRKSSRSSTVLSRDDLSLTSSKVGLRGVVGSERSFVARGLGVGRDLSDGGVGFGTKRERSRDDGSVRSER